jgi:hypothetical protein
MSVDIIMAAASDRSGYGEIGRSHLGPGHRRPRRPGTARNVVSQPRPRPPQRSPPDRLSGGSADAAVTHRGESLPIRFATCEYGFNNIGIQ